MALSILRNCTWNWPVITNFLNPERHQNCITSSKVTAILVKGKILPIGGVASGSVCACSLRSKLVVEHLDASLQGATFLQEARRDQEGADACV